MGFIDNLSRPAYLLIPESAYLKSYTPLAAVNEDGVWFFTVNSRKELR